MENNPTISIVVAGKNILINDKTFKLNDMGVLYLTLNEMLSTTDNVIQEFDRKINMELSSKEMKEKFYRTLIQSGAFSKMNICTALRVSKEVVDRIINIAMEYEVVVNYYSQWKVIKEKKAELKGLLETSRSKTEKSVGVDEILDQIKSGETKIEREHEEQEETIHNPETDESVLSTMNVSPKSVNKKSMQTSPARKNQEIPKKKTLPIRSENLSQKPSKVLKR
jgi:hypothetical protein